MRMFSSHTASNYLSALRDALGSSTDFGVERFTGLVIGKYFCVTHHCAYEFNKRVRSEKNTAIGHIKKADNGSEIRFFTTKGDLRPQMLLPEFLIFFLISFLLVGNALIGFYLSILSIEVALFTALYSSITEQGKNGRQNLLSLLKNPVNPYEHIDCEICKITDIHEDSAYIQFIKSSAVIKVPLVQIPENAQIGQRLLFSNNEYTVI